MLERHPQRAEHRKRCSTASRHRPAAPRRSDRKRTSTPLPNRTDHDKRHVHDYILDHIHQ